MPISQRALMAVTVASMVLLACETNHVTAADPPTAAAVRTVNVTVQRHSTVSLSEADADRILADMSSVLQTADVAGDVATAIVFTRVGPVTVLPANVPGVIQSQANFNTLMAAGTGVKIVRQIRWCGGPGGSIIGCAPLPSAVVNVSAVRFTASLEGILWAHEYGHNCGLDHRTNNSNALMFPSVASSRRVVTASESAAYLRGPSVAVAGAAVAADHDDAETHRPKDIRQFVRQHFFDGVPFEVAASYKPEDADVLLKMLAEPKDDEEFLPEIVTTLCFIGSEKAVEPLIKFVKSPMSSQPAFNAKNAALIHMGDLINKSGSKKAMEFLTSIAAKPAAAMELAAERERVVAAAKAEPAVTPPTHEELAAELAVSATWGLALTGNAEAEAMINRLGQDQAAMKPVREITAEAAQTSKAVRAKGQKGFYEERKKHRNHKS